MHFCVPCRKGVLSQSVNIKMIIALNKETSTMKATNYKKINNIYPCIFKTKREKLFLFLLFLLLLRFFFILVTLFFLFLVIFFFRCFFFVTLFFVFFLLVVICSLLSFLLLFFLPFLLLLEVLVLGCVDLVPFCLR